MNGLGYRNLPQAECERIAEKIRTVLKPRSEILFAFLYGSFPEGSFFRDIDIGIFLTESSSLNYWDYEGMISREIENEVNFAVSIDVRVVNKAPISFCFHVIRGELLFARDKDSLSEFMIRTARSYLDFAPIRRRYIIEAMT